MCVAEIVTKMRNIYDFEFKKLTVIVNIDLLIHTNMAEKQTN